MTLKNTGKKICMTIFFLSCYSLLFMELMIKIIALIRFLPSLIQNVQISPELDLKQFHWISGKVPMKLFLPLLHPYKRSSKSLGSA